MLIVVPGITGNMGRHLALAAFDSGHQVRGLGRSPEKLDQPLRSKLESFVEMTSYYDIAAVELACHKADAIVVAYSGKPELQLEGQLILLRAAERAGIRRFHAASWNTYWPNLALGDHEMMDSYLCFAHQASLSSPIKPIYLFTGVLTEVFFSLPGHGDLTPANNGLWDPENKKIVYWGSGSEPWNFTTEHDAARYSIALISRECAENGGSFKVHSGTYSPLQVKEIYESIRGRGVGAERLGSVTELGEAAFKARHEGNVRECWRYIGLFYQLFTLLGSWNWTEEDTICAEFPEIQKTSLQEWLIEHPEV